MSPVSLLVRATDTTKRRICSVTVGLPVARALGSTRSTPTAVRVPGRLPWVGRGGSWRSDPCKGTGRRRAVRLRRAVRDCGWRARSWGSPAASLPSAYLPVMTITPPSRSPAPLGCERRDSAASGFRDVLVHRFDVVDQRAVAQRDFSAGGCDLVRWRDALRLQRQLQLDLVARLPRRA